MELQRISCGLELKLAQNPTDDMTFEGYGAVFSNTDSYGDVIAPGAFAESLQQSQRSGIWPALLLQHGGFFGSAEDMTPIGVIADLAEDGKGLWMQAKLAETSRGKDSYTLLKMKPRPAINGLSIGYIPKEWTSRSKPDEPRRTLKKVDLMEISLVTFPANPKARVQAVKSIESISTLSEAEAWLRDEVRLSHTQARAFVSRLNGLRPRDAEGSLMADVSRLTERLNKLTGARS